jgi:hypothetical protein
LPLRADQRAEQQRNEQRYQGIEKLRRVEVGNERHLPYPCFRANVPACRRIIVTAQSHWQSFATFLLAEQSV